jgi:dTMP kinase
MNKILNGLLISIEGIDGSGKSSLAKGLEYNLTQKEFTVLLTKEPGGTALGKTLRSKLLTKDVPVSTKTEYLLFATDRSQHSDEVVMPALQKGSIVISDRMGDSSLVYQGYGRGLDIEKLTLINNWAMNNRQPDIVFYLKLSAQEAYKRIEKRNEELTSFEKETEFMHTLEKGFDDLFKDRENVITLDGLQPKDILVKAALSYIKQWVKDNS